MLERIDFSTGFSAFMDLDTHYRTNYVRVVVGFGSVHEAAGEEGIAHAIEHAVHEESNVRELGRNPEMYATLRGINANAMTSKTHTLYKADGVHLQHCLKYLSGVTLHPKFTDDGIDSVLKAVDNEARGRLDSIGLLHDAATDQAVHGAPYGRMIIGHVGRLSFSKAQIAEAYQHNYIPSNMTAIVVGNASRQNTEKLLRRYFRGAKVGVPDSMPAYPSHFDMSISSGLVVPTANMARISWAFPLEPEVADDYAEHSEEYDIAASAIFGHVSACLREELRIAYATDVKIQARNHPNAWDFRATACVSADNLSAARKGFEQAIFQDHTAYHPHTIEAAIAIAQRDAAERIDSPKRRINHYVTQLGMGNIPEDPKKQLKRVQRIRPKAIRYTLDGLVSLAHNSPLYEHITGTETAVKDVRYLIDIADIA